MEPEDEGDEQAHFDLGVGQLVGDGAPSCGPAGAVDRALPCRPGGDRGTCPGARCGRAAGASGGGSGDPVADARGGGCGTAGAGHARAGRGAVRGLDIGHGGRRPREAVVLAAAEFGAPRSTGSKPAWRYFYICGAGCHRYGPVIWAVAHVNRSEAQAHHTGHPGYRGSAMIRNAPNCLRRSGERVPLA